MSSFTKIAQTLPGVAFIYENISENDIHLAKGTVKTSEIDGYVYMGTLVEVPELAHKLLVPTEEPVIEEAADEVEPEEVAEEVEDTSEQAG